MRRGIFEPAWKNHILTGYPLSFFLLSVHVRHLLYTMPLSSERSLKYSYIAERMETFFISQSMRLKAIMQRGFKMFQEWNACAYLRVCRSLEHTCMPSIDRFTYIQSAAVVR